MSDMLQPLLETFGKEQEFESLALDESGYAALEMDNGLLISLFAPPDCDHLLVMADIGPCPQDEEAEEVYEGLLHYNYGARADREGVMAVEAESGRVQLLFAWPKDNGDVEAFTWFMRNVSDRGTAVAWEYNNPVPEEEEDALGGALRLVPPGESGQAELAAQRV